MHYYKVQEGKNTPSIVHIEIVIFPINHAYKNINHVYKDRLSKSSVIVVSSNNNTNISRIPYILIEKHYNMFW